MRTQPEYLRQTELGGFFCCQVLAMLNALRYYGRDTISASGHQWHAMVEFADCQYEDTTRAAEVAEFLGLVRMEIPLTYPYVQENLPATIPLVTRHGTIHTALAVDAYDDCLELVNYKGHLSAEVVSKRPWNVLRFPPRTRTCWSLLLGCID